MKRSEVDATSWAWRAKPVAYWGHLPLHQIVEVHEVVGQPDTFDAVLEVDAYRETYRVTLWQEGRVKVS
ncbi:hypothetical protein Cali_197 [Mycobacterium phage Cali]|uniref:Uncharacterized protein n=14 Tax=Bixzunavirus TaxID=680114 RepID=B5LKS5_9CAUD|nr:hypothetical protein SCOTTMCG_197 [Mycobacterium phage ScottMcG]YP_002224419.1 gp198 [Mycobacterium phage Spud]YP_002224641.1 gp197 [Mycobacterium phage Cali]YP_003347842.1 hypothetical protein ET08_192 [Mycobacterium phage ET08]YP_009014763.1 hypothetical protein LINSTU_203 [Mycobacterium phage LinStu]YP_009017948.1 hypothetical protein PLEIONE_208 [Mycobacterium phage Pleione]YP_009216428.1 hypothetical protein ALICE_191 [Mycobacterium phage Alice]YP_009597765.1 hypothetical protein FDH